MPALSEHSGGPLATVTLRLDDVQPRTDPDRSTFALKRHAQSSRCHVAGASIGPASISGRNTRRGSRDSHLPSANRGRPPIGWWRPRARPSRLSPSESRRAARSPFSRQRPGCRGALRCSRGVRHLSGNTRESDPGSCGHPMGQHRPTGSPGTTRVRHRFLRATEYQPDPRSTDTAGVRDDPPAASGPRCRCAGVARADIRIHSVAFSGALTCSASRLDRDSTVASHFAPGIARNRRAADAFPDRGSDRRRADATPAGQQVDPLSAKRCRVRCRVGATPYRGSLLEAGDHHFQPRRPRSAGGEMIRHRLHRALCPPVAWVSVLLLVLSAIVIAHLTQG